MGRELQKRKRRSSRPTIKQPNRPKHALNPMGNSIVAKNWNKKETLSQNYRRLGLVAKLGRSTGGVEPEYANPSASGADGARGRRSARRADPFAVKPLAGQVVTEARVERDASGKIIRILGRGADNPLNDPLRQFDSDSDDGEAGDDQSGRQRRRQSEDEEWGGIRDDEEESARPEVVRQLEREASRPFQKSVRYSSRGEAEWLERLVRKHGDDTASMARDMKLNPMQQSQKDISKRLKRWRASCGGA